MSALKTLAGIDGRACRSGEADEFFPKQADIEAVRYAQRLCMGCPIWGQCALDAIRLVEAREMADCVIAAVHLPCEEDLRREKARAEAVAQLRVAAAAAARLRVKESA